MSKPVLIDTDMGVDDAVAVTLALSAPDLEVLGLASVGGNVSLDQATTNIYRLLGALGLGPGPEPCPIVARGLGQSGETLCDATHVHGRDGLGELDLPAPPGGTPGDYLDLYERLIEAHGESLTVVAIGPLTNLAGVLRERPGLLERVGRIVVMGGAVWCSGNVTPHAEFNFHRDPAAAAAVLGAGLPITVVPLDVTRQVVMDESHTAHLSRSGTRAGDLLARILRFPIEHETPDAPRGQTLVHDALAVGVLLWPELFMRSKMTLEITTAGEQAGRARPRVSKGKYHQVTVVISVNVGEFLDKLLDQLCHEKFFV